MIHNGNSVKQTGLDLLQVDLAIWNPTKDFFESLRPDKKSKKLKNS